MAMEDVARVYAEALFEAAKEKGKLDEVRDQLGQFTDAVAENRDLQLFFFSPYFSSAEKREARPWNSTGPPTSNSTRAGAK